MRLSIDKEISKPKRCSDSKKSGRNHEATGETLESCTVHRSDLYPLSRPLSWPFWMLQKSNGHLSQTGKDNHKKRNNLPQVTFLAVFFACFFCFWTCFVWGDESSEAAVRYLGLHRTGLLPTSHGERVAAFVFLAHHALPFDRPDEPRFLADE